MNYFTPLKIILNEVGFPYEKLPVFEIGNRTGATSYIDFISPSELTSPIMRFTDINGREGVIFLLTGKGETKFKPRFQSEMPLSQYRNTFVIFQRYSNGKEYCATAWGNSNPSIADFYHNKHETDGTHLEVKGFGPCKNCPLNGLFFSESLFRAILTRTDPYFELARECSPTVKTELQKLSNRLEQIRSEAVLTLRMLDELKTTLEKIGELAE